jgi:hypothetical protein
MTGGRARRNFAAFLLAAAIATGGVAAMAPAAGAWSYGHAYLVVGNWNCVGGGKVTGVFGAVDQTWTGGDWNDNVIWPTVRVGVTNTFNGRAYCDRPWYDPRGDYWINVVWWQFGPTANNQTFWY